MTAVACTARDKKLLSFVRMQNYSKVLLVLLYKYAEARRVKNSFVIALQTYIKTYGRQRRVLNNTYAYLLLLDALIY